MERNDGYRVMNQSNLSLTSFSGYHSISQVASLTDQLGEIFEEDQVQEIAKKLKEMEVRTAKDLAFVASIDELIDEDKFTKVIAKNLWQLRPREDLATLKGKLEILEKHFQRLKGLPPMETS